MQQQLPSLFWRDRPQPTPQQMADEFGASAADAAHEIVGRYERLDPQISAQVLSSLPENAYLDGPEHRIKSIRSTARKIRMREAKGMTTEQAVAKINDLARYFIVVDNDDELLSSAQSIVRNLNEQGWEVTEAEHSFVEPNRYKGTAAIMQHTDGHKMELSFHTKASIAVKVATHLAYDVIRDPRQPKALRQQMFDMEVSLCSAIPTPPGLGPDDTPFLGGKPMLPKQYAAPAEEDVTALKKMLTGEIVIDKISKTELATLRDLNEELRRDGAHSLVQRLMSGDTKFGQAR